MRTGTGLRGLFIATACIAVTLSGHALRAGQAQQSPAAPSTTPRIGEWRVYGADLANTKYSPLDQINAENFSRLRVAWRWQSADGFLSRTVNGGEVWASSRITFEQLNADDPKRWRDGQSPSITNFKATPLMINGTLYLNTPLSIGAAVNGRTGETTWVYNPKSYEQGTTTMSARWNQRGVAYWTDGKEQRIYWGTGDGYLVAVDARTGEPVRSFGQNGKVDLMTGLPQAVRGKRDWLNALTYSVQSPPIVVRDTVVTPASISSYNNIKEQIPGYTRGWDARTGKLKWTFNTIPRPGEFGNNTWENDSWAYTGKVSGWSIFSADEELGYLYVPLNTAAPDYYGGHRLGDGLFAESLLCLDVNTGKRVWHFQMVHHGLWDYDLPAAPNLLDVTINGQRIKAVAQVSKQGFLYAFDRVSGKPLWPIEERPVPPSDVPGERASKTQPFPTKPAAFEYQGVTVDDLVDFTPEIRKLAIEATKNVRMGPLFTPPSVRETGGNRGTIARPSASGGANWSGAAVDPDTGLLYVPSRNQHSVFGLEPPQPNQNSNLRYMEARGGGGGGGGAMPQGLPLFKPPYSRMTAINMNTGDHAWMTPLGDGNSVRNHPMLKGLNLPPVGGDSNLSGPLLTRTLLITALTRGGTKDGPRLVAYDKATGRLLASTDLPALAIGTPMTYLIDGKQYIALTVATRPVPELIALALP
jgi:quinoprotein glucose dehydrogenase